MINLNFCRCVLLLWRISVSAFGTGTLNSVSVIFRHGDRTPEAYPKGFYPNDPYKHLTFEPIGYGGLTNKGKRREHQIGTSLRSRYDGFLSGIYKAKDISVISTNTERTKMSLLLVLAGLYPPKEKQLWKTALNWQPIPINSIPYEVQSFMGPFSCPKYLGELERVRNSEEYKKEVSRFDRLSKKLSVFTGREMKTTNEIYHLYHTLTGEAGMHLRLPAWTKAYFPNGPIINATLFEYKAQNYNTLLKALNGGSFIRKILNDLKINNDKTEKPKLHLYSCHEDNIAAVLHTLNLWKNVIPEYASGIVFELHKKDSSYFLKILYYKGKPAEFETQIIPGCTEYCPLEDFLSIEKDVIPDYIMEACFGLPSDSLLVPKSSNPIVWIYNKIREWFDI